MKKQPEFKPFDKLKNQIDISKLEKKLGFVGSVTTVRTSDGKEPIRARR